MRRVKHSRVVFLGVVLFAVFTGLEHQGYAREVTAANDWGAGIILGEPTGITVKHWVSEKFAYDAGVSYSFGDFILLNADALWHFPTAFAGSGSKTVRQVVPYVGGGATLLIAGDEAKGKRDDFDDSDVGLGLRIPLGAEWLPERPKIGVFVELSPVIGVIPGTFFDFQGGAGARVYF